MKVILEENVTAETQRASLVRPECSVHEKRVGTDSCHRSGDRCPMIGHNLVQSTDCWPIIGKSSNLTH